MFSEFLIDATAACSIILLAGWAREVWRPSPDGGGDGPPPAGVVVSGADVFDVLGIAGRGPGRTITSRSRRAPARSPWNAPGSPR